ncbi:hypothetical protein B0J12DRAFT_784266 [Macrophomina phaseolina]|uniref:FAD-binding domain-containing protein n=1 Tax=Macrophomina phaseolina TaxID=35725 RepID=A0ABQ8GEX1_9PEZI|nr:hypothetical protein B0J12DRAFT_784266 [Macrophomina phaseolina]
MAGAPNEKTQVIIVGGGVTGLVLALMLERLKISYFLLEAYPSVTPDVGASIGLFANGLGILEQLGVYDDVRASAQSLDRAIAIDGITHENLAYTEWGNIMEERHGYNTLVLARYELVRILERYIERKDRLLVNKRLVSIDISDNGVVAHCEDGLSYEGSIIVGADGVRSTVRQEMWRLADELEPGYISEQEKSGVRCEYACLFGKCRPLENLQPGDSANTHLRGGNVGYMVGRSREIFFMRYWKLPGPYTVHPTAIPRFTEQDKQAEMKKYQDLPVSRDGQIQLKDIINNVERINITALPDYVFKKWYFRRVVMIGDAAHKFNPLVGQGGNNCIESAAALVNHLRSSLRAAKTSIQSPHWPTSAVEAAFSGLQEQRVDRVTDHVEKCEEVQRAVAWDTWLHQFLGRYVQPYMSPEKMADGMSRFIVGGLTLDGNEWRAADRMHKLLSDGPNSETQSRND